MSRRSAKESKDWEEFTFDGRTFVRARVPKGNNAGQLYTVASRLAERYEVKGFFASGGCGLILRGRDLNTETEVLIKTTLDYKLIHEAQGRDLEGMRKRIREGRKQLQSERRIMVLMKNLGCNGVPNPNDYVYDWNPALAGPYRTESGATWQFDEEPFLANEPYLIMEQIDGLPVEDLIGRGMPEERALRIMLQVAFVLRVAHRPLQVRGNTWKLIYQDLKPANILVGAHDYVSLLDWGGCRLYVNQGAPVLAGASTPGYCPPEAESQLELTQAADSFTVGSTLYHMFTGKAPSNFFSSAHTSGNRKALRRDDWDESLIMRTASSKTVAFVFDCLRDDPKLRPANGAELYDRIAALLR